jgi:hypothetical protein
MDICPETDYLAPQLGNAGAEKMARPMLRTVGMNQPTYLPWLGYFEQIARAEIFVFLDMVQYEKESWQCRNRLKSTNGEPFWLTVPVAKQPLDTTIREIRIAPGRPWWRTKHLRSIQHSLGTCPYFHEIYPHLERWLNTDYQLLADLNIDGIQLIAGLLGLSPKFIRASQLAPEGHKTRLVVGLCKQLGASQFYCTAGSKTAYMAEEEYMFAEAGIQLTYQSWLHPTYRQRGAGFVSHLSAIDALMNIGPEATRALVVPGSVWRGESQ